MKHVIKRQDGKGPTHVVDTLDLFIVCEELSGGRKYPLIILDSAGTRAPGPQAKPKRRRRAA